MENLYLSQFGQLVLEPSIQLFWIRYNEGSQQLKVQTPLCVLRLCKPPTQRCSPYRIDALWWWVWSVATLCVCCILTTPGRERKGEGGGCRVAFWMGGDELVQTMDVPLASRSVKALREDHEVRA